MSQIARNALVLGRRTAIQSRLIKIEQCANSARSGQQAVDRLRVARLVRVRIGTVRLGRLRSGEWRELTSTEIRSLGAGAAA